MVAEGVKFGPDGLAPAVVQDARSGEVLMLGYMNQESLERTLSSGQVWFYSRSRQDLWHKGDTSGNVLHLRSITVDCDGDTLLVQAEPAGPTCHTGEKSCFFQALDIERMSSPAFAAAQAASPRPEGEGEGGPVAPHPPGPRIVEEIFKVILDRQRTKPEGSYVSYLLEHGIDKIGKKIGEEAAEVIIAAKNGATGEMAWEVADLWFHSLVMLAACGMTPDVVWAELEKRRSEKKSNK